MGPSLRYGIAATYRCNLSCKYCNRFLDQLPWLDSDLSLDSLEKAGKLVHQAGINPNKARITGGEPTLHPDLPGICRIVREAWNPTLRIVVLTNKTQPLVLIQQYNARYSWDGPEKAQRHRPWMISPVDLGLQPKKGFNGQDCWVQRGCGRLFDTFGFAACVFAGALGRILGLDPYQPLPVLEMGAGFCQHCICSLPRGKQWAIWKAAQQGELAFPTKTFAKGLARCRAEGTRSYSYFEER